MGEEPYRKDEAVAEKARHLTELGMTQADIAKALRTTPKTVRRALHLSRDLEQADHSRDE